MKVLKTIGTHNGTFHCDEVLGCSMLKLVFPNAQIVRSREQSVLDKCDIVIDVGGKYDPDKYLFDHHQNTFHLSAKSILPNKTWSIKLSSAGLVYCHFGKEIIKSIVKDIDDASLEAVFDKVYEGFVQEVDAIDNGIPICDGEQKYWISTNLSSRISRLNQRWTVPDDKFDETKAFKEAMKMASKEFVDRVKGFVEDWLPAKRIVLSSVEKRFEIHSSGEIILLEKHCPWKSHLFTIEEEQRVDPKIKYVIFKDTTQWRVQAVSLNENSFVLRIPLHECWRGLRDEELIKISGIDNCIFVHSTGFIGGNKTFEGALLMAEESIKHGKK